MSSSQHQPPTEYYSPASLDTVQQAPQTQPQPQPQQFQQYQSYQQVSQQYHLNPTPYGQPFVPYQPPAQVLPPTKLSPPRNEKWEKAKIGLHAGAIVICVIGLGMTFSLIGYNTLGLIALYCCPILIIPLLWSTAELLTRWKRPSHHGIHPGAHVGVSLLTWMFASIIGGTQCTSVALGVDSHSSECYNRRTHKYDLCDPVNTTKQGVFAAVAATTCLVFVIHFALFVGACVDTAKRNAYKKAQVMVVQQPYWGPVAQGWQPVPQNQEGQQDVQMQNTMPVPDAAHGNGKEREVVSGQGTQGTREYYA